MLIVNKEARTILKDALLLRYELCTACVAFNKISLHN